jgi:geranylgeranylglycerol-phosphate geranylgeranyltransferase
MDGTGSSNTSWRTSESSSTSDPDRRGLAERLVGWIRLTHPFPSVLDGVVVGAVAVVAGGSPGTAARLAVAMTLLQLGIGTVNDVVDAPRDLGLKPGKPIAAGFVTSRSAIALAVLLFVLGLALAASGGAQTLGLAAVVMAIGLAYDLWLKGTVWSWLPFAVGIPLLPVFGWLGARGTLPPAFGLLIPMAILAGGALAVGNTLVDVERDRAAGLTSVAARLGPTRASHLATGLFLLVGAAALSSALVVGASAGAAALVGVVAATPVAASVWSAGRPTGDRERAWQLEAVGLAALAASWVAVMGQAGRLT